MRIAVDAVGAKHGGAEVVTKAVLEAACRSAAVSQVIAFVSARSVRRFDLPASSRLLVVEAPGAEGAFGRLLWHGGALRRRASRMGANGMLCLSGGGYGNALCPSVLFIQQSLPFSREAMARQATLMRFRMRTLRQVMRLSAKNSARVIVQTQTMKSWISQRLGIQEECISVIEPDVTLPPTLMPAPELEPMRAAASNTGDVLLYVGGTSSYKNVDILPGAMEQLVRTRPGAILFGTFPRKHRVLRSPHIHALPPLPRVALREAYRLSAALVVPSLVETVGLPMLEAALVGTPVIAADRPYAHEVCGAGALFFDPLDPHHLAKMIDALLSEAALRRRMVDAGRQNLSRRTAAKPYDQMIEIALNAFQSSAGSGLATGGVATSELGFEQRKRERFLDENSIGGE